MLVLYVLFIAMYARFISSFSGYPAESSYARTLFFVAHDPSFATYPGLSHGGGAVYADMLRPAAPGPAPSPIYKWHNWYQISAILEQPRCRCASHSLSSCFWQSTGHTVVQRIHKTIQGSSHRRQSSEGKSMAMPEPQTPLANLLGRDSHNVKRFLIVLWNVAAVERVQAPAAVWWCAGTAAEGVRCRDNAWSACSSTHFHQANGHTRLKAASPVVFGGVRICAFVQCPCRHVSCL